MGGLKKFDFWGPPLHNCSASFLQNYEHSIGQVSQVGFELMSHCNQPMLSMQDLCLDLSEQNCILSLCQGLPRVWSQKSGKMSVKMGSSGSCPPACLTSSNRFALLQEHILRGPGAWGGGPESCSPDLNLAGEMASKNCRQTYAQSGYAPPRNP
eukprot:1149075-Pelagomonas_calceolata.AAC.3